MSRDIDLQDPDSWDEDDKMYLAQRGQLPTDVMSESDQRKMLDPTQDLPSLEDQANTGTVNTAALTTEQLEAELEKRRAAEHDDPRELMVNPGGLEGAEDDEEEALEPPYDQYSKAELSTELSRRNGDLESDDEGYLQLSGTKQELVDRLEADDAENAE